MANNSGMRYLKWWRTAGAIFLVAVVVGSLLPLKKTGAVPNDKLVHFLIYFLLMAWFGQLYPRRILVAIALALLGILLELTQGFTRYRYFEWYDVVANCAGILSAWAFVRSPWGHWMSTMDDWLRSRFASNT